MSLLHNGFPRLFPKLSKPHFWFLWTIPHAFAQWFAETISTILQNFGVSKPFQLTLFRADHFTSFWFLWTISRFRTTMVCQTIFRDFGVSKLFELTLFRADHLTSFLVSINHSSHFRTMVRWNHFNYFPETLVCLNYLSWLYSALTTSPHFLVSMDHLPLSPDNGLPKPFQLFSETLFCADHFTSFWFLWTISCFCMTMVCRNHFNYFLRFWCI